MIIVPVILQLKVRLRYYPTAASNNRIDLALAIPVMVMIAVSPVAKRREFPIPQSPRSPIIVQILFANPARDANAL